jgi:large subunit ribosomal protein L1
MKKTLPENYNANIEYKVADAVALLPLLSTTKFVGSVNIDIIFGFNDKQKKESVRGSLTFPNQLGSEKKIIVFTNEKDAKIALANGAEAAGLDELVQQVEAGSITFDVALATPDAMPRVARLGKVLGPKGLMPSPANQTVTTDLEKTIKMYKAGKFDFKMGDQGAVRAKVAKLDMTKEQIVENVMAFIKAVYLASRKVKSAPFKKIIISPTMGERVKLDINSIMAEIA